MAVPQALKDNIENFDFNIDLRKGNMKTGIQATQPRMSSSTMKCMRLIVFLLTVYLYLHRTQ